MNIFRNAGGIAALIILLLWSASVIWRFTGADAIDLEPVYLAARFVWLERPELIYGGKGHGFTFGAPAQWQAELANFGMTPGGAQFVFPPIWAFLLSPIAGNTDPLGFFLGVRVALVAAFSASVYLAFRLSQKSWSPFPFVLISIFVAETTAPFQLSIALGQAHLIIIFLMLISFLGYYRGMDGVSGTFLGLAAAIKLTPILFVLMFLVDRRYKAAIFAALVPGALALLSVAVAGVDLHLQFLERLNQIQNVVPVAGLNLTFETMIHDFFIPLPPCPECLDPRVGRSVGVVSLSGSVLLGASFTAVLWLTRSFPDDERLRLRMLPLVLASIFFGPLGWMHYYVFPLLLFLGQLPVFERKYSFLAGVIAWCGFSAAVMTMAVGDQPVSVGSNFYPQHVALVSIASMLLVSWWSVVGARRFSQQGQRRATRQV